MNVGKVTAIERQPGPDTAIVTMTIDDKGLPIHKDATAQIRPRIFLEGNFFVDLRPGTPATPTIGDGDTLPVSQTAGPVQLDQVLTALQQDTRSDLQRLVKALATGLTVKPSRAADRDADPERPRPDRGRVAQRRDPATGATRCAARPRSPTR